MREGYKEGKEYIYIMDTVCTNQNEKVVLEGESIVKWEKQ